MTLSKNPDGTISICCCDTTIVPCPHPTGCANLQNEALAACPIQIDWDGESLIPIDGPCATGMAFSPSDVATSGDLTNCDPWPSPPNADPAFPASNTGANPIVVEFFNVSPAFFGSYVYTNAADFVTQLEADLNAAYQLSLPGSDWTVSVSVNGDGTFRITNMTATAVDITATGTPDMEILLGGVLQSCHSLDLTTHEGCWVDLRTDLGAQDLTPTVADGSSCTWTTQTVMPIECSNNILCTTVVFESDGPRVTLEMKDPTGTTVLESAVWKDNTKTAPYELLQDTVPNTFNLSYVSSSVGSLFNWCELIPSIIT